MASNKETLASVIRYCAGIGLLAIDRPRASCKWRTAYCNANCFNCKLERAYTNIARKDERNAEAWRRFVGTETASSIEALRKTLNRKRKPVNRVRLMTRGEAFACPADVFAVAQLVRAFPTIQFWIPTRAWRNPEMRRLVNDYIRSEPNAFVQASIDPSNTAAELEIAAEWPTMFFGKDSETAGRFKCPKTWNKVRGACAMCNGGCFARANVHLKKH